MNHNPYSMEDINDIVLNRNGNDKSASVKKILTAIAILIILFLIVLIIMKFINKGNIDTSANLQMPSEAELAKKEQAPKLEPIVITPKPEPKKEEPKVEVKKPEQPKIDPSEPQNDAKFEIKKEEVKVDVKEQIIEIKKEEPQVQIAPTPQTVQPQPQVVANAEPKPQPKKEDTDVSKKYKLINVVGINNQLQATIEELSTGQNKRIAVGKELDGYIVKAISLNDGIVFEKDGVETSLNIGK